MVNCLLSIIMINKKINTLFTEIVNNLIAGNCFNSAADQAVSFFVGLLPRSPTKGLAAGQQNHFIVITLYQQQPSSHSNLQIIICTSTNLTSDQLE